MFSFNQFLTESKTDKKDTLQDFLDDIIDSYKSDFGMSKDQAEEFISLYIDQLEDCWENGYTTREAIASTQRPGVMIKEGINESYVFDIDDTYETYIEKINTETKPDNIKCYIDNYYNKFNESYSDKRIFERVKNNYKNLKSLADKRIFEMQYTTDVGTLEVDVIERNDELIDNIIDKFSYNYKKKKERYLRPTKITGKTTHEDIELEITLSNKDIVKISYDNKDETEELKVHINDNLIYHMDYFDKEDIVTKTVLLYDKFLEKQNYKVNKKTTPFN